MTRAEKDKLRKWARSLSSKELEHEMWEAIYQCLGSETEEMYERGYDLALMERYGLHYDYSEV